MLKTAEAALYTLWANIWAYTDVVLPCERTGIYLASTHSCTRHRITNRRLSMWL